MLEKQLQKKSAKRKKRMMNDEIKKYPIFILRNGRLVRYHFIQSTDDYDHNACNLHHFITNYEDKKDWYDERGIEQKLILVSVTLHEHIHGQGVCQLTDDEFKKTYKISRWELVFNRKHSKY